MVPQALKSSSKQSKTTSTKKSLGLSVSPVNWAQGDFVEGMDLYVMGIVYGTSLISAGFISASRNIKKHFDFTYHNFGLLLVYFGALAIIFDTRLDVGMALVLIPMSVGIAWYCWNQKKFLFFLYSCVSGYIALTYLLFEAEVSWEAMLFYFPITCIGGVVLLIRKRSHFSDDE